MKLRTRASGKPAPPPGSVAALSLRYPDAELAEAAAGGEWDEAAGEDPGR
ncbi:hypothetical protein HMPREF9458_03029, partial [Eggerthella lenta 1_1_60AFAA]